MIGLYISLLYSPLALYVRMNKRSAPPCEESVFRNMNRVSSFWNSCKNESVQLFRVDKSIKNTSTILLTLKKPSHYAKIKNFLQTEDIGFNIPLLCYKFPLSEHTEDG